LNIIDVVDIINQSAAVKARGIIILNLKLKGEPRYFIQNNQKMFVVSDFNVFFHTLTWENTDITSYKSLKFEMK